MKQPDKYRTTMKNSYWILVSKYLAGECTEAELEKLNNWIEKSNNNRLLFNNLMKDRELIDKYIKMKSVDVDKAWNNVSTRIVAASGDKVKTLKPAWNMNNRLRLAVITGIAASILILAGLFFVFKSSQTGSDFETVYTANNTSSVSLPDGSKIYLNRNSQARWPKAFSSDKREVILEGEAFFEVTPNRDRPFLVKAGDARVEVVGTSFSVNENKGKNNVRVFVETGKVKLYHRNEKSKSNLIEPGYIGQMKRNTSVIQRNTDENIIAWKTGMIIFSNTRLSEVIRVLENVYGKEITIKNKEALNWLLSGAFDNQSFESVIKVVAKAYQFNIEQHGDKIVLSGGVPEK